MRSILLITVVLILFSTTVLFAQAGPKREEGKAPKPDTTSVAKPAAAKQDTTPAPAAPEKKPAKPAQPASPPTPAQPATPAAAPAATDAIARAVFATSIVDREPVGEVDTLSAPVDSVYFFTAIVGMEGQTVTHRWVFGDNVMAEVPISVGASHWRAYSKKRMLPELAGTWTVEVVDAGGNVVARKSFVYRR